LSYTTNASQAKEIIESHLKHYEEIQEAISDEMIIRCLEYLTEEDNPIEEKKKVMKRLPVVLELLGTGFSRHEIAIYKTWWREFRR
jgi:DNA-binding NarL/FixJ family response regulator